ncbi:MAG: AAA family ATPase [bacterium]|nr:AAA family ATPase [bacterium]
MLVAPPLSTTRLADVTPRAVQWLWPGRIPLGKITTFDGDPGVGKSTILADLAARVSSGASMPDGSQGSQGDVIIMTAEDDPDDTIRPRVEAAGADLERVHVIDMDDGLPSVVDATDELIATIAYLRAQLLIVDPFATFAGTSTRTKNTQSTAQAMSRIKRAASDTGCAVVLVRHLNKDVKNGRALYRGTDSIAIIGTARSGLVAGTDPDDGDRRVLAVTKSNLAPPMQTQSLGYRIASVEGPAGDTSRVDWLGRVSWDADEIIGSVNRPVPAPARESATEWLRHLVAEGPVLSADVEAAAEAAGHSMRTVKRAKDAAGVESKKRSDGRWQYQRKGAS